MSKQELAPELVPYVKVNDFTDLMTQYKEGVTALEQVKAFPCETPEQEQFCADGRLRASLISKAVDARRTAITKPLLDAKRAADALFNPTIKVFDAIEDTFRQKIQAAQQRRQDAERAARAAAVEAARQATALVAQSAPPVVVAQATAQVSVALAQVPEKFVPSGISSGAEWEAELVDLSQVPREWLTVDWSKVKIHQKAYQKSEHIPPVSGFKFRRVATVRAR